MKDELLITESKDVKKEKEQVLEVQNENLDQDFENTIKNIDLSEASSFKYLNKVYKLAEKDNNLYKKFSDYYRMYAIYEEGVNQADNYFSNILIKWIVNKSKNMSHKSAIIHQYKDKLPFKISKEKSGIYINDNMYIFDSLDFESQELIDAIVQLKSLKEKRLDMYYKTAIQYGYIEQDFSYSVRHDASQNLFSRWKGMFQEEEKVLEGLDYFSFGKGAFYAKEIEGLESFINEKEDIVEQVREGKKKLYSTYLEGASNTDIEKYPFMVTEFIREKIKDDIGLDIRNLNIKEQLYFIDFISKLNIGEIDALKLNFRKIGLNGIRSFLSIEQGGEEMGEKIISIGENYPKEVSTKIFEKYAEIVDEVDKIEAFLVNEFGQEDAEENKALVREISEDLLKKGKVLLATFSDKEEKKADTVLEILDAIKAETELFKTVFKKLSECRSKGCSLEDARSLSLETIQTQDILGDDTTIARLREIYKKNYPDEEDFSEEFRRGLLTSLDAKLANENTEFYIVKKQGEVIGFNSFTALNEDEVEFANFNLDSEYAGARIGGSLLDETLFKIAKEKKIKAVALKGSRILDHYVEDLGFTIVNEHKGKFVDQDIVEIELDIREKENRKD